MKKEKNTGIKLKDFNKEIPFKVPEDYFNRFPTKLAEAIRDHDHVPASVKFLSTWKPYAAAAILIVVAVLSGTFIANRNSSETDPGLYSEISDLVENELYSINEQTILEMSEMKEQNLVSDSIMSSDEVIHYLMNEDIENELMNEL